MLRFKFFNALTIALLLLQAMMPIPALAMASAASQQDYDPGSVVTISGNGSDGFVAGETIQVEASGPNGISLSCQATADDNGAWSCDVTVPSDDSAAGDYSYMATGETSGASKSGSFTVTAAPPPTVEPTQEATQAPTQEPTQEPTATQAPTVEPTTSPTAEPIESPTVAPTEEPSASPTASPTEEPKLDPTDTPTPTPTGPVLTPFITSDKDDYFAGELVTLTSGDWQPNESVHLVVNDVLGDSWRLSDDVSANTNGEFVYKFNLPNWFVAQYHVYAFGTTSGAATWDFTDSVTSVTITAPTNASPVTITSLPATVTFSFSYVTSSTGATTGTADVVGTTATNSKSLTPGSGSNSIIVTIPVGTANGTYNAKVTVTNSTGGGSNNKNDNQNGAIIINVPVCTIPSVTTQPVSQTVTYGAASVAFSAAASGSPAPTIQWQVNTGSGFTNIGGATSATLTINNPAVSLSGNQYRAVFTNTCGPVSSNAATLTVNKATPTITWANPADISYGTVLGGSQLNAAASVPGSLVYTPASGTVLSAGNSQTLHVDFTPTDTANYNTASKDVTINVLKRAVTITADAKTKIYGDADPALTYQVTSGTLATGDSFSGALSRAAGESVDTYAITQGTLSLSGNYALTFVGADLFITARPIAVKADNQTKTYGDTDPALTYSITSGSLASGDSFSGALTRDAGEDVGTYAITQGTLTLNSNYNLSFANGELSIGARAVTVTADAQSKVYGDADPALTYQVMSGSLASGDSFSGALTRDVGEDVGTYTIQQGTLALNSNYALTFVGANLSITARPITVTVDAQTKVYGNTDPALTYQITSGSLVTGDSFSGALTRDAGEDVGTYAIEQGSLALSDNYALTYVGTNLSITARPIAVTADAQTKIYGQSDPALTYQVTSGSLAFSDGFSGSLTRAGGEDVGDYAITQGTLVLSSNYDLTFVGANLSITKATLTVKADNQSKTYGQADPAFTFEYSGFQFSEDASDVDTAPTCSVSGPHSDAGSYVIACSGGADNNYAFSYVDGTLSVGKALLTVTADDQTVTYGDADPAFSFQYSGFVNFDNTGDVDTAPTCDVAGAHTNADSYTIVCSGGADNNYAFAYENGALTVDKALLTVTADDKSREYGDANPAFTYQITGFKYSDDENALLTPPVCDSAADASSPVSSSPYEITCVGAVADNYDFSYVPGDLTITKAPLTVTPGDHSKVYGDVFSAFTGSIVGIKNSDDITATYSSTGADATAPVGAYNIVATLNDPDGKLPNYEVTSNTGTLTVTARPVTVTADPQTKVYGEANPALTYQVTSGNLVNGDSFTGSLAREAGEDVGSYAISQSTLALDTNYSLTFEGADLSITARPITVTADAKSKVYGEADPSLTHQITSGSLAFSDAFSGALNREAGEDVGAYDIAQGTLALSTNYNLTYVGADFSISMRPVTVTADAQTKTYGEADPALSYQITSGSLAFTDGFSGSLTRAAGEDVGSYSITQGALALSNNYALSFVGANLTITKRDVEITADAQSKTYGDLDPALTFQVTNGSLAFTDAFTGSLTRDPGESVGDYAINQGTVALNDNYHLSYVGANLSVTKKVASVTPDAASKTYGDVDPVLTGTLSGFLAADGVTATYSRYSRASGETVGIYTISATLSPTGVLSNYDITYHTADFEINKKAASVTPDTTGKIYGDDDPSLTGTLVGFLPADSVTATYSRTSGETVDTYTISASLSPAGVLSNYDITYNTAEFNITKRAVEITADAKTKVYGNNDPTFTYHISNGTLGFSDTFSGALGRAAGEDVGSHAITQGTLALNSNYDLSFVGADLTITKRPIEVTADAKTKVYGDADPAPTYQITSGSLAFSDAFSGALARVSGENVGDYAINQNTLALSPNYSLTYVGANLSITARPVTITTDAKTKVYGATDPALTYQITNGSLAFSDTFTGGLSRALGENVGTYAINQNTLMLSSNYALTYVGANLSITKATLTVTADNQSKYFGAADPAFTFKYSGFVNSETASVIDTPPTCGVSGAHAAVGTYPIVCSGGNDNNYSFSFVSGTLTVGAWTQKGFYSPVDMNGIYNTVKNGSTVPLKFELFSGTTELTDVSAVQSITAAAVSCQSGITEDAIEVTATGSTSLRYDATSGQFIYNWKTPSTANKCYKVTMTAADSVTTLIAFFKLK